MSQQAAVFLLPRPRKPAPAECHLNLTDRERRDLMRLMHRVLEEIEVDKNSYRILLHTDPNHGHLVKDGTDITELTNLDETAAHRFLGRLQRG